ncbi:SMP-30/gluconolactonase/LRE family protein [Sphingomonas cavernae]|uniref:SMP-30/gluconolactonase/LRE family protein n=1 Tax=Sphingomonas cavernae TaxID=2320861 RepID=A0A418WLA5_9SPHN|nr:SMP-30/gluconolactonase/LRE family protein [Sphingomonas cavernae]RJF90629.1 SMP-30/gluconolactonase/LRE family protein [Sphingomonas cavernae]
MADVRVIERAGRDRLGEGPLWSRRRNALFWVDILGCRLHQLSLADGAVQSWTMPEMTGWVVERDDAPGFIAGLRTGFAELELDPFTVRHIVDPEPGLPGNRMNDAKADGWGRIWAGTMPVAADRPSGALYRLDTDRSCHTVDTGYTIANGPAFSLDGRFLYHADSHLRVIYRFAIDEAGVVGGREPFIAFEPEWGVPDGMTVDAEGGLWIAHWGAGCVSRFSPEGVRERAITLPASQVTSCAFAGEALDRLFVTSAAEGREDEALAGALFEVDPGVTGIPPASFGG